MPTIKRKVEMNLPQLIEWLLESGKSECIVISNMNNIVQLEPYGVIRFSQEKFYPEDTFTVEVEEEITEDMKLYLVERYISSYEDFKLKYKSHQNKSIKSILEHRQPHLKTTHFYTEVNNELVLIWKNGKLVE